MQLSALAQFAPDLAAQLVAPSKSRFVVAWAAKPVGPPRSKKGRFSSNFDALLAFALDRFATVNAPVEGGIRRNFDLVLQEYFPSFKKNALRMRYDYCVHKVRSGDTNALRDLAHRWGYSARTDGSDGDDNDGNDSVDVAAETVVDAGVVELDKNNEMEAVLGPLRRQEWDGSVCCSHCTVALRKSSMHRCRSCAIVYCDDVSHKCSSQIYLMVFSLCISSPLFPLILPVCGRGPTAPSRCTCGRGRVYAMGRACATQGRHIDCEEAGKAIRCYCQATEIEAKQWPLTFFIICCAIALAHHLPPSPSRA